jgi:hypothetical protein
MTMYPVIDAVWQDLSPLGWTYAEDYDIESLARRLVAWAPMDPDDPQNGELKTVALKCDDRHLYDAREEVVRRVKAGRWFPKRPSHAVQWDGFPYEDQS